MSYEKSKHEWVELSSVKKGNNFLEPDPMTEFKHTIIRRFRAMQAEMMLISNGNISSSDVWDVVAGEAIPTTMGVANCVLAVLAVFGILSALTVAAIAIPLTVAGLVGVVSYNIYRDHKKKGRFKKTKELFDMDDAEDYIEAIAETMTASYRYQLSVCSRADARKFANACFEGLSYELMNNPKLHLSDLTIPSVLNNTLQRSVKHIPEMKIYLSSENYRSTNTKILARHPAVPNNVCRSNQSASYRVANNHFSLFSANKRESMGWGWRLFYKIKRGISSLFKPANDRYYPIAREEKKEAVAFKKSQ